MVMQFEYPRNALLDLSPINDAIDFRAKQQQRAKDNAYRDEQLGMQRDEYKAKARERAVRNAAGIAQMALEEKDPTKGAAVMNRLIASDPRWGDAIKENNIDPADWQTFARTLVAEARGPQDPLERDKTKAQINAANAQAAAAYAQAGDQYGMQGGIVYNKRTGEARPAAGESASGPWKDPKQKADVEEGLRKEVTAAAKDYQTISSSYNTIKQLASKPSAAADMSMIFAFMKILDPASVVREGEFANAQNAAGVPDRVTNLYNRILSGERLNDAQRADFTAQAETIYKVREAEHRSTLDRYRGISGRLQVDPRNVLPDAPGPQTAPPPGAPTQGKRLRATNSQGQIIESDDGVNWRPVN